MPAPTPPFEMVAMFRDSSGAGWSEKYWLASNLGTVGLQSLFGTYAAARMQLASIETFLLRMRVESTQPKSPYVIVPPTGPIPGTITARQNEADVALLCRMRSSPLTYYNRVFLRGIPEEVTDGEVYTPTGSFAAAISNFESFLVGNGNFVVRTRIPSTQGPLKPIVTAGPGPGKGITIVVPLTVLFNTGDILLISGSKIPGYNGLKVVTFGPTVVTTGNQYTLGGANPISTPPPGNNLSYRVITYTPAGVASFVVERVSNRKAGRPFGESRGRARTLFSQRP